MGTHQFAVSGWVVGLVLMLAFTAVAHDGAFGPMPQPPVLAQAETAAALPEGASCALTLRLVDDVTGVAKSGLVHLRDGQGQTIRPAELLPRTTSRSEGSLGKAAFTYMDRWHMLPGERTIQVPCGPLTITAFSGLNTRLATAEADLSGKTQATVTTRLEPLGTALGAKEQTGNVHLHLRGMSLHEAERYATEVAMAEGLDVVFLSYLERTGADEGYISNTLTGEDLRRSHERSGVLFGYGEEHRHNFPWQEGYGHVMFLDLSELILPASFGPDIMQMGNDDGTLRPGIVRARDQKATVLWCHNAYGLEDIPSWVAGLNDGQIIFDGGARGGYDHGFYRYLNVGMKVPVSMGTDWSYNDMAMTVVAMDGALSIQSWLAVRAIPFAGRYDQSETREPGFNEYGNPLFAHKSPVCVELDDKSTFIPDVAESLIAELRSSMATIRHTGDFTNEEERKKVLAIYQEAIETLRGRLNP